MRDTIYERAGPNMQNFPLSTDQTKAAYTRQTKRTGVVGGDLREARDARDEDLIAPKDRQASLAGNGINPGLLHDGFQHRQRSHRRRRRRLDFQREWQFL